MGVDVTDDWTAVFKNENWKLGLGSGQAARLVIVLGASSTCGTSQPPTTPDIVPRCRRCRLPEMDAHAAEEYVPLGHAGLTCAGGIVNTSPLSIRHGRG
jgi:hypothetical protein